MSNELTSGIESCNNENIFTRKYNSTFPQQLIVCGAFRRCRKSPVFQLVTQDKRETFSTVMNVTTIIQHVNQAIGETLTYLLLLSLLFI